MKKELVNIIPSEDVQRSEEDVIITEVTKKTETVKVHSYKSARNRELCTGTSS